MIRRMRELWCKAAHGRPMWPMHGKYICSSCFREYPVKWGEETATVQRREISYLEPIVVCQTRSNESPTTAC